MANHNLVLLLSPLPFLADSPKNVEFLIYGTPALAPNTVEISRISGVEGFGSLGLQANNCYGKICSIILASLERMLNQCIAMWGRYPNFLLIDFYDSGSGSVFKVLAKANNVTYLGGCCGKVKLFATGSPFVNPIAIFVLFGILHLKIN
jgi:hypothetical protein